MNEKIKTFNDIIDLWKPKGVSIHDTSSVRILSWELGLEYSLVYAWYYRMSIPPYYWRQILKVAKKKKLNLSAEDFLRVAEEEGRQKGITSKGF